MDPGWVFLVLLFFVPASVSASQVYVNVGDSAELTADRKCADGEEFRVTTRDNSLTVARHVEGVFTPGGVYADRIELGPASSVIIHRVNYNDRGVFDFFCGAEHVSLTDLVVVAPARVSVLEGEAAVLPCYAVIKDVHVKARWEKDGELVSELDRSGPVSHGAGFEGRASPPLDWYSTGDMSLTLERVGPGDMGHFTCYIFDKNGQKDRGNPEAVTLRVDKRNPITRPPPPPTEEAPAENIGPLFITSITLNVLFVPAAIVFFVLWLKTCKSRAGRPQPSATRETGGTDGTDVELGLVTGSVRTGSQVSGA
ncbi:uncharacterized protein si:dkey-22i16.9 [Chelmon rostratus]|uniref:uncharacterized protein si:dkey-22i16.9 n=1 Tax=Chelmon rostratus TaxID=109905 RepID=UPI001BE83C0F|nr:uncharacterized protein si:dkey-22i16.9 [Chelmon rostratus]